MSSTFPRARGDRPRKGRKKSGPKAASLLAVDDLVAHSAAAARALMAVTTICRNRSSAAPRCRRRGRRSSGAPWGRPPPQARQPLRLGDLSRRHLGGDGLDDLGGRARRGEKIEAADGASKSTNLGQGGSVYLSRHVRTRNQHRDSPSPSGHLYAPREPRQRSPERRSVLRLRRRPAGPAHSNSRRHPCRGLAISSASTIALAAAPRHLSGRHLGAVRPGGRVKLRPCAI